MKRLLLPLALALTACGAVGSGFENPFGAPQVPALTLTVTPSTLTLAPGATAHVGVATFSGSVTLGTPAPLPVETAGIRAIPDASGMTVSVSGRALLGSSSLPIQGLSSRGQGQTVLDVVVGTRQAGGSGQ
ncbi:hypothetical protein E5F05_04485 (plasmid) [Deinococcus metallilatus]|uniref:Lipoprotein n=1 Tax=Deinococcus metallilatus TaxID=1211322 RepID=A0AAJ5F5B7_9DEIO|nr:hypothetical protein [Deinococcus metallilatus]MBB5293798.1 hypothetical protein [Deinococcus metallilatus]QBY07244.1 hypothetical protein E5F05_04485 [Deinococcus metallilatus]RXJ14716.1 hypothetical protein ERJ73_03215 [Deinococcus metallilatus]TLK30836.1 hypothetical protein FCS05_03530 [Deinococcus metallilatus]GMA17728.1 hypothetical protein GCM10025871_40590 [Deinococcus metallilatus]